MGNQIDSGRSPSGRAVAASPSSPSVSPSAANDRCTCAEVCGENPECTLHGVETRWALANTSPEDWQEQVLDLRRSHDEMTVFLGSRGLWNEFCDDRCRVRRAQAGRLGAKHESAVGEADASGGTP